MLIGKILPLRGVVLRYPLLEGAAELASHTLVWARTTAALFVLKLIPNKTSKRWHLKTKIFIVLTIAGGLGEYAIYRDRISITRNPGRGCEGALKI